ncbi:MAG: hypothetical protein KGS61_07420 [Verrucomicrobia bacterium]|nr:hypothetical protein [Verrucomicrobiota bacterium]
MATTNRWERRLLYTFLIGKRDRSGLELDEEVLEDGLAELGHRLKHELGGATRIRTMEAEGQTVQWATEKTALIVIFVPSSQENQANALVARLEPWLVETFRQDEVWIAKDEWKLFIARAA